MKDLNCSHILKQVVPVSWDGGKQVLLVGSRCCWGEAGVEGSKCCWGEAGDGCDVGGKQVMLEGSR